MERPSPRLAFEQQGTAALQSLEDRFDPISSISVHSSSMFYCDFDPRHPPIHPPRSEYSRAAQKNIKSDEIVAMIWMIRAISIALSFYNFRSILTSVLRHRDRGRRRRRRRDQEEERERCSSFRAVNLPSVRDVGRMKKAKVKRKKEITLEVFPPLSLSERFCSSYFQNSFLAAQVPNLICMPEK